MVKHKQMVAASASMHAFLKQGNLRIDHADYALSYLTLAHILAQVLPVLSLALSESECCRCIVPLHK